MSIIIIIVYYYYYYFSLFSIFFISFNQILFHQYFMSKFSPIYYNIFVESNHQYIYKYRYLINIFINTNSFIYGRVSKDKRGVDEIVHEQLAFGFFFYYWFLNFWQVYTIHVLWLLFFTLYSSCDYFFHKMTYFFIIKIYLINKN